MKIVISEYASMIVSLLAALGFFKVVSYLFLGEQGFFATVICAVLGG